MKKLFVFLAAVPFLFVLASTAANSPPTAPQISPPSIPAQSSVATEDPAREEKDPAGTETLVIFCPTHQGCEAETSCRKKNGSCTNTFDTGENSCQLGPGTTFDCPPNKTVQVETCECSGSGCSMATGTYLTCD